MGHVCPKGPRCTFSKQGKCKFLASECSYCDWEPDCLIFLCVL